MKESTGEAILEELCAVRKGLAQLSNQLTRTNRMMKEIKEMARLTQADIDQMSADMAVIKTAINKVGADLAALEQNTDLNADDLRLKIGEVRAQVQSLDDQIPEQTPPA